MSNSDIEQIQSSRSTKCANIWSLSVLSQSPFGIAGMNTTVQLPRLIAMFNLDTLGARRRALAHSFVRRLKSLRENEETKPRQRSHATNSLLSLRSVRPFRKQVGLRRDPLTKAQGSVLKDRYREAIYKSMKRPFPAGSDLPPALQMHGKYRKPACRWHSGTYPMHYRFLPRIGLQLYLDDLKLLSKQRPSKIEWMKI